jgi:predicted amidophosphoribosyltransferase
MWPRKRGCNPQEPPTRLRCSVCALDWPPYDEFVYCPQCEEKTAPMKGHPMSDDEARRLKNRAAFERDYGPIDVT